MRGAEPSALAGPPASYPPVTCVRRKEKQGTRVATKPRAGRHGDVGARQRGPAYLEGDTCFWPEGKGDRLPLVCGWGGGLVEGLFVNEKRNPTFEEGSLQERGFGLMA